MSNESWNRQRRMVFTFALAGVLAGVVPAAPLHAERITAVERVAWQPAGSGAAQHLVVERERYTNLDAAGRSVLAARPERGNDLSGLQARWRLMHDSRTLAERRIPLDTGLVSVSFDLEGLEPGAYEVHAEFMRGRESIAEREASFVLEHAQAPAESGEVALLMPEGAPIREGATFPVNFGVPMPKGAVSDLGRFRVLGPDGSAVPAQFSARSRWGHHDEASIRWLGVNLQAGAQEAYWPNRSIGETYVLEYGPNVRATRDPATPLRVNESDDAIDVDTGPLRFSVRKDRFNLIDRVELDGRVIQEGGHDHGAYLIDHEDSVYRALNDSSVSVSVERSGPMRTVIRAEGWYVRDGASGDSRHYELPTDQLCRFVTRIEAYAGKPYVRVLHTWILTFDPHAVRLRDVAMSVPIRNASDAQFGVEDGEPIRQPIGDTGMHLLQYEPHRFDVASNDGEVKHTGTHSDGVMLARSEHALVGLAHRDTWQRYPKELEVRPDALVMHVWPSRGRALDDAIDELAHEQIHRLHFAHSGEQMNLAMPWSYFLATAKIADSPASGVYNVGGMAMAGVHSSPMGAAITSDMMLWFGEPSAEETAVDDLAVYQHRPHLLPDPTWVSASGALGPIHPHEPERFPQIEQIISQALRGYRAIQDHTQQYGMWIYRSWHQGHYEGDGKLDLYRLYNATHHYEAYIPWLMYARSGDPFYLQMGRDNTRMLTDVQMVHHDDADYDHREFHFGQGRLIGSTRHTNSLTPWGGDHGVQGHMTAYNGIMLAYYLTGDLRWREVVVDAWQDTLLEGERNPEFAGADRGDRVGRDNNNALGELIDLYQLTYCPALLVLMDPMIERFYEDMTIWGLVTANLLEFRGDARVESHLVQAVEAERTGESFNTRRALHGGNRAMMHYALASLIEPTENYFLNGVWNLGAPRMLHFARQYDPGQPSRGGMPFVAMMDTLLYLPNLMHAMAAADPDGAYALGDGQTMLLGGRQNRVIVRQDEDAPFDVRLVGQINEEGVDVQVIRSDGELVTHERVPAGYGMQRVTVPADGHTGEYTIFINARENRDRLEVPLTDLPGEVYWRANWSQYTGTMLFTRPTRNSGDQLAVRPNAQPGGRLLAADRQIVLAETNHRDELEAPFPDEGVWLEMLSRYVRLPGGPAPLAVDPSRWFEPSEATLELQPRDIAE